MTALFLKVFAVLILISVAGWASIKYRSLLRTGLQKLGNKQATSSIRIHETLFLGPGQRLVVLDFEGARLLVSASGRQLTLLCSQPVNPLLTEHTHAHV